MFFTLLLVASFPTVQGTAKCDHLESRISAYYGFTNTSIRFDLQFYNPNAGDIIYNEPIISPRVGIATSLIEDNFRVSSLHVGPDDGIITLKFSPGITTISVIVHLTVGDTINNTLVFFLPDGTYTANYYHSSIVTSYPAILEFKSGTVTVNIPEPAWNYDKQGSVTKNYFDRGTGEPGCPITLTGLLPYFILGIVGLIIVVIIFAVRRKLRSKKS